MLIEQGYLISKKLFFRQTVTPLAEGIDKQMRIVKTFVARHLTTYEVGLLVGLILSSTSAMTSPWLSP